MKKWFSIMLLIMVGAMLGACNESKASIDLSTYPESVQNGDISVKFYDNAVSFVEDYELVYNGMMYIYETEAQYPDSILLTQYVDAIAVMDSNYKENIKPVKLKPKTDKDKEINQLIKNIITLQGDYNESMWTKAENAMSDGQTTLFVDRGMLSKMFEQLKDKLNN